eukprot:434251_1
MGSTHSSCIVSCKESNIDSLVWKDHLNGTNKYLWQDSLIPYVIDDSVENDLRINFIAKAINEFNTKTPIQWICKESHHINWVTFKQVNNHCPMSQKIGKKQRKGSQWIKLPYPKYPNSTYKLKVICVMHEMMHVLGFHHEQIRCDAKYHCKSNKNQSNGTIAFGQYDYLSIMHYPNRSGFIAKNRELSRLADSGTTFSQGDLAALRRIYGKRKQHSNKLHFGEWHEECATSCIINECNCGNCGPLSNGLNCGYEGMNGHWTCCMNEDKNSFCNPTHTGFWHMKCSNTCSTKYCFCNSCGKGCTYEGNEAHWSCCDSEQFVSKCTKELY